MRYSLSFAVCRLPSPSCPPSSRPLAWAAAHRRPSSVSRISFFVDPMFFPVSRANAHLVFAGGKTGNASCLYGLPLGGSTSISTQWRPSHSMVLNLLVLRPPSSRSMFLVFLVFCVLQCLSAACGVVFMSSSSAVTFFMRHGQSFTFNMFCNRVLQCLSVASQRCFLLYVLLSMFSIRVSDVYQRRRHSSSSDVVVPSSLISPFHHVLSFIVVVSFYRLVLQFLQLYLRHPCRPRVSYGRGASLLHHYLSFRPSPPIPLLVVLFACTPLESTGGVASWRMRRLHKPSPSTDGASLSLPFFSSITFTTPNAQRVSHNSHKY